jgi:hypothetical protein
LAQEFRQKIRVEPFTSDPEQWIKRGNDQLDALFNQLADTPLSPYQQVLLNYFVNGPGKNIAIIFSPDMEDDNYAQHGGNNPFVRFSSPSVHQPSRSILGNLFHELSHIYDRNEIPVDTSHDLAGYHPDTIVSYTFREFRANLWATDWDYDKALAITIETYKSSEYADLLALFPSGTNSRTIYQALKEISRDYPDSYETLKQEQLVNLIQATLTKANILPEGQVSWRWVAKLRLHHPFLANLVETVILTILWYIGLYLFGSHRTLATGILVPIAIAVMMSLLHALGRDPNLAEGQRGTFRQRFLSGYVTYGDLSRETYGWKNGLKLGGLFLGLSFPFMVVEGLLSAALHADPATAAGLGLAAAVMLALSPIISHGFHFPLWNQRWAEKFTNMPLGIMNGSGGNWLAGLGVTGLIWGLGPGIWVESVIVVKAGMPFFQSTLGATPVIAAVLVASLLYWAPHLLQIAWNPKTQVVNGKTKEVSWHERTSAFNYGVLLIMPALTFLAAMGIIPIALLATAHALLNVWIYRYEARDILLASLPGAVTAMRSAQGATPLPPSIELQPITNDPADQSVYNRNVTEILSQA